MASIEDITAREVLLKASGLKAGRVLDVGMGGCACMALFLAHKGFDVTGVDRSPHAVHEARGNARKCRCNGSLSAHRADATRLPFASNTFDAVISFHSLHHIKEPVAAIREMFRVGRSQGMVLIADLNATGRKLYKHKADRNGLLQTIERVSRELSSQVKIADTRLDRLFICRIKGKESGNKTRRSSRGKGRMPNAPGQTARKTVEAIGLLTACALSAAEANATNRALMAQLKARTPDRK